MLTLVTREPSPHEQGAWSRIHRLDGPVGGPQHQTMYRDRPRTSGEQRTLSWGSAYSSRPFPRERGTGVGGELAHGELGTIPAGAWTAPVGGKPAGAVYAGTTNPRVGRWRSAAATRVRTSSVMSRPSSGSATRQAPARCVGSTGSRTPRIPYFRIESCRDETSLASMAALLTSAGCRDYSLRSGSEVQLPGLIGPHPPGGVCRKTPTSSPTRPVQGSVSGEPQLRPSLRAGGCPSCLNQPTPPTWMTTTVLQGTVLRTALRARPAGKQDDEAHRVPQPVRITLHQPRGRVDRDLLPGDLARHPRSRPSGEPTSSGQTPTQACR